MRDDSLSPSGKQIILAEIKSDDVNSYCLEYSSLFNGFCIARIKLFISAINKWPLVLDLKYRHIFNAVSW